MTRKVKQYNMAGRAGCLQLRKAQSTGTLVGIYNSDQAGLNTESGTWSVVCEEHGAILGCEKQGDARAQAADPQGWCEGCRQ